VTIRPWLLLLAAFVTLVGVGAEFFTAGVIVSYATTTSRGSTWCVVALAMAAAVIWLYAVLTTRTLMKSHGARSSLHSSRRSAPRWPS
jgi:Na+/melibiose symporter-like transporter